eukprot:TRINITY_DN11574_c0_g1_i3.p2 TRINITY_DN11574_c0_g1~~TRINITY_DN11574_c0_g1_i3.p2  ORF type:complete len:184 (+),score=1.87 TRINITY_DN11574_c0_g1_i3:645-1196(+)
MEASSAGARRPPKICYSVATCTASSMYEDTADVVFRHTSSRRSMPLRSDYGRRDAWFYAVSVLQLALAMWVLLATLILSAFYVVVLIRAEGGRGGVMAARGGGRLAMYSMSSCSTCGGAEDAAITIPQEKREGAKRTWIVDMRMLAQKMRYNLAIRGCNSLPLRFSDYVFWFLYVVPDRRTGT